MGLFSVLTKDGSVITSKEYQDGYAEGMVGKKYSNPYMELSLEWLQYDKGYDDGLKKFKDITLAMAF